ncbi:centriole, cilia and spindle-associated protein isoform X1 [Pantherophis guttatus]|uniref:Centriole, cilia and spindle-associated protein isoform X1 n=1 Tax=Pantherophis guttatus TaxID=94885 RepID=A0A6P9CXU9_PANGU|nr:centriole, cilia and spindle-associated protein isoform X1 [Pantherophis guttatus]
MVPSRCVKSEYMKCFKEPKWEACGPCYQELLRYRLSRRLLEQAHRPWFWDDWEQDSSLNGSSGSSPSSQGTSSPPVVRQAEEEAAHPAGEIEVPGGDLDLDRISAPGEDVTSSPELAKPPGGPEVDVQEQSGGKAIVKKDERKTAGKGIDSSSCPQKQPLSQKSASGRQSDRKGAKNPQRTETTLGIKHPFALYGWGEKQTDTGSQKTHNVRASASVNEVSERNTRICIKSKEQKTSGKKEATTKTDTHSRSRKNMENQAFRSRQSMDDRIHEVLLSTSSVIGLLIF